MPGRSEQDQWVQRVLGVELSQAGDDASDTSATAEAMLHDALAIWSKARGKAVASLSALEGAIRKMGHPAGDKAIILVRAIAANLTADPGDERQVVELRRYLETDDIIGEAEEPNGFGIAIDLRDPLLGALEHVEWALQAA